MSKLPDVTGTEAIEALRRIGFQVDRITGSHHILKRPGHLYCLTVPVHGNKSLTEGLLRRLIRDAGLTVEEFTELLK